MIDGGDTMTNTLTYQWVVMRAIIVSPVQMYTGNIMFQSSLLRRVRRHVIVQYIRHTNILMLSGRDYYWHHWQHHRHNRIARLAVFIDANAIITDASIYLHYRVSGIIDNITDMPTQANLNCRISDAPTYRPYLYCHVGDIIDSCDNIGNNIAIQFTLLCQQ